MPDLPVAAPDHARIKALASAIHSELQPVYHVTPGGLKWSVSTDAVRELVELANALLVERQQDKERIEALSEIGREIVLRRDKWYPEPGSLSFALATSIDRLRPFIADAAGDEPFDDAALAVEEDARPKGEDDG